MPVKIPRLQQIQASKTMSGTERITSKIPDSSRDILSRTQGLVSLGAKGLEVHEKYEDNKIDRTSNENEKEYSSSHEQRLQQIKNTTQGDPTDAYNKFEEESKKKYDEILKRSEGLSGRVKRGVIANLNRVRDSDRIQMLKQRGMQMEVYKNNLYESTLKMKQNKLTVSASDVRPGEDGVYDEHIKDLKTVIAKRGVETGGATVLPDDAKSWDYKYEDTDGKETKVKWNPLSEARLQKELNTGVSDSINVALDAGEKDQAMLVYEKYKKHLTPKESAKFLKKVKKKDVTDEAFKEVARIEGLPKEKQLSAINKIKDEKVKQETIDIKDARERKMANMRERRQDTASEKVNEHIEKLKESGNFNGMSDVRTDTEISGMWNTLSHKQQKSIEQQIKQPKITDQKAFAKILEVFNDSEKFKTLTDAKFQELLVGLNKSDRAKMTTRYFKFKDPKTDTAQLNAVSKILKQKLIAKEFIEVNDRGVPEDNDEYIKLNKAYEDLQVSMTEFPSTDSVEQISKKLDEYLALKKKDELFGSGNPWSDENVKKRKGDEGPGWFSRAYTTLTGGGEPVEVIKKAETKTFTDKNNPLNGLKNSRIGRFQIDYKRINRLSKAPKRTDNNFLTWVEIQLQNE